MTTRTLTTTYGLQLVTDRTLSDVLARNPKGTYNATDLNRVGAAMLYVADKLTTIGYNPKINVKLDWSLTDFPTVTAMQQYLSNLAELKSQFNQSIATPKIPDDMSNFTWEEANNIEKILEDIDSLISNIRSAWFYSNEIYSGEV